MRFRAEFWKYDHEFDGMVDHETNVEAPDYKAALAIVQARNPGAVKITLREI